MVKKGVLKIVKCDKWLSDVYKTTYIRRQRRINVQFKNIHTSNICIGYKIERMILTNCVSTNNNDNLMKVQCKLAVNIK